MIGTSALLGVITLPALAPLIALIQLLFPGLLGDHWKQYRAAISVMLTQSTLYFGQWLCAVWLFKEPQWWLSDAAIAWGTVIVAACGYIGAVLIRPAPQDVTPAKVEYLAFWGLGAASAIWLVLSAWWGRSWLDPLLVMVAGCVVTIMHLALRRQWGAHDKTKALKVPSEIYFLLVLMIGGAALNAYALQPSGGNTIAVEVRGESLTFRRDRERSGTAYKADVGPKKPKLLWSAIDPPKRGQLFIDSSPTVVNGVAFVGGFTEVLAFRQGVLIAVTTRTRDLAGGKTLAEGNELWRYEDAALRPVFASASIHGGKLYVGEGYHEDKNCRLMCFDAGRGGAPLVSYKTTSHTESTPTIDGGRIYIGAGDDGLYAFDLPKDGATEMKPAWHVPGIHADASPLAVEGRVYVGGVVGDLVAKLEVIAVDAKTGDVVWRKPTEVPIPDGPTWHDGGVLISLGNGKLNQEHDKPVGGVWRLDAKSGDKQWEFSTATSVLSSPIVSGDRVYIAARGGECFCLDAKSGERIWRSPLGEPIVSSPIVSGGRMFVVSAHGVIHCLDVKTGDAVWTFDDLHRAAGDVYSSPVLVEGRIYLVVGGRLHCVGDAPSP